MHNKVEICGVNTSKLKVLKNEETMDLLRRTKEGDKYARETLINGNLRLVLSVIQKFTGRGENADDLFQVGCVGLIKAIDNFDISQPVKFSTYGVPMTFRCPKNFVRYAPSPYLSLTSIEWSEIVRFSTTDARIIRCSSTVIRGQMS